VWNASTNEIRGGLAKLDELVEHVSSNYREGTVLMIVITPGNPLPTSAQRKELEAFFTRWTQSWRAIAYVAEGTDLWSMTARTVMTGMRLVQRRSYPTKVFSEVPEAAQWASEYLVKAPGETTGDTARSVQNIVEELRRMAP
jgi:hypothetical protein